MIAILGDSRSAATLVLVLTLALLLSFHWRATLPPAVRRAADAILGGTVVLGAAGIARAVYRVVTAPPIWDFHVFWSYGRVAVAGANFYDPAAYSRLLDATAYPPDFLREVFDVGFFYPPPSIWLFAPLGWLGLGSAAAAWMTVQVACLVACIVMLWRLFLPRTGAAGLALTAAIALLLGATTYTVYAAQTNFLLLLLLLMFWRRRDTSAGGVWLAAATLVKPVAGVLALYPLVRRRWKTLAAYAAAGVVSCGITALAFGWPTVRSYFVANPANRMPHVTFVELTNQSLLATVLRAFPGHAAGAQLARDPIYLLLGGIVIGATAWCALRLPRDHARDELALATLVPAGLLVYPGTLTHYSVILLMPLLWLWERRGAQAASAVAVAALIAMVVAITGVHAGTRSFFATLLVWGTLVAMSIVVPGSMGEAPGSSE